MTNRTDPKGFKPIYGNYRAYYLKRSFGPHAEEQDPRLDSLFEYLASQPRPLQHILDVGSNTGRVAIQVASLLDPTPTKVIGLDLDAELIRQAKNAVRYTWSRRRPTSSEWNGRIPPPPAFLQDQLDRRAPSTSTTPTTPHETRTRVQQDLKFFPACFPPMLGSLSFPVAAPSPPLQPQAYPFDSFDSQNPSRLVHHQEFPNNISFVVGDIMNRTADPAWRTQGEHFDLVLCLSLTKWIQIHHGDQGLLQLFDLFAQLIGPGGLLLLEPHGPASSFERTKDGPATVQFRPKTVRMTPDQFPALLAGRGFDLLRRVQPKQPNHTASAREVLLFQRQ